MSIISETDLETLKQYVAESCSMRELQRKLGYSENGAVSSTIRKYCASKGISLDHFTEVSKNQIKRTPENTFIENSSATQATLRRLYKKGEYTPYVCSICDQEPFWNGKELTLTLDHINGNNKDDRLENLRWVCPNCDRQLDTFGSKNNHNVRYNAAIKSYCQNCGKEISRGATLCSKCRGLEQRLTDRPSKDELKEILFANNGNFTKVSKMFKVTDNAIRKWCKSYDLPFHSSDYKNK